LWIDNHGVRLSDHTLPLPRLSPGRQYTERRQAHYQ
jgi:hypothetical protein